MSPLRELVHERCGFSAYATFDDRPSKLFNGMHHCRVCIVLCHTDVRSRQTLTTKYHKWYREERKNLLALLHYQRLGNVTPGDVIPKLRSDTEQSILRKTLSRVATLGSTITGERSDHRIHRDIETTVVSYLAARPTGNLVGAAWQAITADWWETQRGRFELRASEVTVSEAGGGDAGAAARRLEALADCALLPVTEAAVELSEALVRGGAVPEKAESDAMHVAVAAVHGVDYLLTWNCRHLDNAETKPVMRRICGEWGYVVPEICTPQELMGGVDDGG